MIGAKTGKGWVLPFIVVFDIYIVWILTSIVGLGITPIEGKLTQIFPGTTELMSQMILIGPSLAEIPFVFLGGALATRYSTNKLINIACVVYFLAGICFLWVDSMWGIIVLCFICGFAAGVLSPLSVVLITRIFTGSYKSKQLGFTSATLNVFLALSTLATGYLADVNWRYPFYIYLLPIVPLLCTRALAKYLPEPKDIKKQADQEKAASAPAAPKLPFSKQANVPALVRYCLFYLWISLVVTVVSQYVPFLFTKPSTAGDLTSILFVGIMLSGYILNLCLRVLGRWVWIIMSLGTFVGMLLVVICDDKAWLAGVGIFIASFFYGIGQPYTYDRCSEISTPVASTLCIAWIMSMDYIADVVGPFLTEAVGWGCSLIDLVHKDPHGSLLTTHPMLPFKIWMFISLLGTVLVVIQQFGQQIRSAWNKHEHKLMLERAKVHPSATSPAAKVMIANELKQDNEAAKAAKAAAAPAAPAPGSTPAKS